MQDECKRMTQEVDLHGSQVPLGETDEEFYQNIYTGQRGFVLPPQNLTHPFQGSFTMPSPLPVRSNNINSSSSRPAPRPAGLNVAPGEEEEEEEDGPHWTCSVCTFRNHPALSKCEQCEMPRISLGTDSRAPLVPSSGCFCHPPKLTLPSPTLVHTGGQAVTPAVTLTPPPTGAKPVTSYTPSPTGARPLSSFTPSPTTSRHAPPFTPSPNRVLPASATPSPTGARPVLSFTPSPTGARPIPPPRRPSPVPPVPTAATGSTSPS
ncbi:hypothetical protein B566_EDAN007794 [Ephemera danica]|nr:hypothetical protein B566_EDAN007794 [Ephemera danica]